MFHSPAHPSEMVTVGNRTAQPLTIMFGGRQYEVPAFPKTVMLPAVVATAGLNQHPVMGSEDPYNPHNTEYLLYVKEWKRLPNTPREQSECKERIDRSMLPADRQNVTLTGSQRFMGIMRDEAPVNANVKTEFAPTTAGE